MIEGINKTNSKKSDKSKGKGTIKTKSSSKSKNKNLNNSKAKSYTKSKDTNIKKIKSKYLNKSKGKTASKQKIKSLPKVKDKKIGKVKTKSKIKVKKKTNLKIKSRASTKAKGKSTKERKISFVIDGVSCTGKSGQSILEAARDNGIYIPYLCYFKGMKPAGICRMCTVKVGGRNMAGCTTPIAEGMIIENNIPELENMRKVLVEMLFVEGNHMCPTCEKSGNCELQALGYRYKMLVPRFPYQFPIREIVATYTKIMIDNNRCVLCRRCIRDITSKDGKHIFAMTKRSGKSTIIADHELEAKMPDELAKKAMEQCPVGAILKKEVGFAVPIGKRKFDKASIGSEIHK